jgi:2'-5' RNA ligase
MRLFVAINFDTTTKSRLHSLRDELRAHAAHGNFSLPENLHLTLAFLGECDAKQAAAAKAAMDAVHFEAFDLTIERVGCFKRDGGDVFWAGAREDKPLLDLQRDLTEKLFAAGFSLDRRRYSPHITLGLEVVTDWSPRRIEAFGETVSRIDLMKSERIQGKLTYTAIYGTGANGGSWNDQ